MIQRRLSDLEQIHLERFNRGTLLEPPHETQLKTAFAVGAHETYSYLLDMDEEDANT